MGHYKGKKVIYNNITFDSISERDYYIQLINDNRVSELNTHPKFIILEGFKDSENKAIRSITFKPDFMYKLGNETYIVDIKPLKRSLIDADFILRWKLLKFMYKDQNIKFRLMAWNKSKQQFVEF